MGQHSSKVDKGVNQEENPKSKQAELTIDGKTILKERAVSRVSPFIFHVKLEQANSPHSKELYRKTVEFHLTDGVLRYRQHVTTSHSHSHEPEFSTISMLYDDIAKLMELMRPPFSATRFDYENLRRVVLKSHLEIGVSYENEKYQTIFLWNDGDNDPRRRDGDELLESEHLSSPIDPAEYDRVSARGELIDSKDYQRAKRILFALEELTGVHLQTLWR